MDQVTQQRLEAELRERSPVVPLVNRDPGDEQPELTVVPEEIPDYRLPGTIAHAILEYLSLRPYREVAWLMELIGQLESL